jgi:hypothetical protein
MRWRESENWRSQELMPIIFMTFFSLVSKLICHLNIIDSDFVARQIWTRKRWPNKVAAFYIDLSTFYITHPFPSTLICKINQIVADQLDFSTLSAKNAKLLRYQNKLFVCRKRARNLMGMIDKCYWYCTSASRNLYCKEVSSILIVVSRQKKNWFFKAFLPRCTISIYRIVWSRGYKKGPLGII